MIAAAAFQLMRKRIVYTLRACLSDLNPGGGIVKSVIVICYYESLMYNETEDANK